MKRGNWRMTVEVLKYGQERPYADHVCRYRVTFEAIPAFTNQPEEFRPVQWSEGVILPKLRAVHGWVDKGSGTWADSQLEWVKQAGPGIWEFQVREAYTG